jgi:hypothetical protein
MKNELVFGLSAEYSLLISKDILSRGVTIDGFSILIGITEFVELVATNENCPVTVLHKSL